MPKLAALMRTTIRTFAVRMWHKGVFPTLCIMLIYNVTFEIYWTQYVVANMTSTFIDTAPSMMRLNVNVCLYKQWEGWGWEFSLQINKLYIISAIINVSQSGWWQVRYKADIKSSFVAALFDTDEKKSSPSRIGDEWMKPVPFWKLNKN